MTGLQVVVTGAFDNPRARDFRFFEEAAKLGHLHVLLWCDEIVTRETGHSPQFAERERKYLLESIRFVSDVAVVRKVASPDELPAKLPFHPDLWVVQQEDDAQRKKTFCASRKIDYRVIQNRALAGFAYQLQPARDPSPERKKVIVTGCYDWLHSGHVRFFEEAGSYGDLYVVLGHDTNIRQLKGPEHPLLSQDERRYLVGSIRFVKEALIATGHGWLDAEPEVERLHPDFYIVNEDGDKGGKREFCQQRGIQYIVLKREPARGLPARTSTGLRGF